jgi:copper chaperone CopZ
VSRDPLNIALAVMTALLLVVAGPWLYQHLRQPQPAERALPMVHEGQKRVTLKVTGMVCGSCAARVGDQLQATAGVAGCDVDPEAKRAYVVCEAGVADTALVGAVRRAGTEYSAAVVGH